MNRFKLDPRTKLLLFFIIGISIFSYLPNYIVDIYIFITLILILLCKKYKSVVIYLIAYCIVDIIIFKGTFILFPIFIYGRYMVLTTTMPEFSLALEKMKVPLGIQIILLVMIRYFPTIRVEFKSILNAMKLRGVNFSPVGFIKHPVKTVEYIYVPLVYSLIKTGDELTIAALTRGLGLYDSRTYLAEIGFSYRDILIVLIYLVVILFGILTKRGLI